MRTWEETWKQYIGKSRNRTKRLGICSYMFFTFLVISSEKDGALKSFAAADQGILSKKMQCRSLPFFSVLPTILF